jgi:hypothetical protein
MVHATHSTTPQASPQVSVQDPATGLTWFNRYARDGAIISVVDKNNTDDVNGKWQIHAATNQINNGDQSVRKDEVFANLFPGLMKKIIAGMQANAAEIKASSTELMRDGYDISTRSC